MNELFARFDDPLKATDEEIDQLVAAFRLMRESGAAKKTRTKTTESSTAIPLDLSLDDLVGG